MGQRGKSKVIVKILIGLNLLACAVLIFLLFGMKPDAESDIVPDKGGSQELNIDIEGATKIDLAEEAKNESISITVGGKYVLVGESVKPIEINADDEVVLYMGNANISVDGPVINNTGSGKIVINSLQGSSNSLKTKSGKGVIVSKGDVEIIGRGEIKIMASDKTTSCIVTEGTIIYNPATQDWYDCADNIYDDTYTN